MQFTWPKTKKKKKLDEITKRKPRWNPAIAPSEPTLFSLSISLSHLSLHLWLGASSPPLIENPLKYCWFCLRRYNTWDERTNTAQWLCERRREAGQWLSSAAARACAVGGGNYGLGYCRRRLRFDIFPLSLSLSLWVFFFFPLRKSWVFTTGRTVENKFFNLVLLNFFSHV